MRRRLTWILSWFERRRTLKELQTLQKREEEFLALNDANPLNLAKIAVATGDLAEGARRWEQALACYPVFVKKSRESTGILLGLKRFDEAEKFLLECKAMYPGDAHYQAGLAKVAYHRGDLAEAIRRWKTYQRRFPGSLEAYVDGTTCLRAAGLNDEAEAWNRKALAMDSGLIFARIEAAWISEQRQDWEEALRRWTWIENNHGHIFGVMGAAAILKRLGRLDEAIKRLEGAGYSNLRNPLLQQALAALREEAGAG